MNIYVYTHIYGVCPGKVQPLLINKFGLCDIDVTWQPRRMDWNAHVNNDDFTVLVSVGGRCH